MIYYARVAGGVRKEYPKKATGTERKRGRALSTRLWMNGVGAQDICDLVVNMQQHL